MTDRPFIMALDLASKCGIAEGYAGDEPRLYSERFARPHDEHAEVFGKALLWLANRLDERRGEVLPDVVYIEAPLTPGAPGVKTNPDTTLRLIGLWAALAAAVKVKPRVAYREAKVSTVRRAFIGHGRVDGGGAEAKRRVFEMCRLLGWSPTDRDASDAGALWWFGCTRFAPQLAPVISPLMHTKVATRVGFVNVGSAEAVGVFNQSF